ncbi:thiol-disulfide oxidoreductase [Sphingobacteriaceae bacterium]|nr:thiol-disulfide oxidoreductase [Sphingobacteriaceae bacterium]
MTKEIQEALSKQPILLFDGECGFCNKTIQFFLRNENKNKRMHFAPLESEIGKALRKYFEIDEKIDSVILVKDHSAYIKSCAALRLAPFMRAPWSFAIVFVIIPPFLRNWVYDFIARRRKKIFGRVESCALLANEDRERFLAL